MSLNWGARNLCRLHYRPGSGHPVCNTRLAVREAGNAQSLNRRIARTARTPFQVLCALAVIAALSQTMPSPAFAADKNVYIDSDGLVNALAAAGIRATYEGDIMLRRDAIGLPPGELESGLALITKTELTDFQLKLASKVSAEYLRDRDFRHIYSLLLIKSSESGSKYQPVQLTNGWGALPCAPKR
jgi:hypothetical protein